jgi:diguanylate cyclase (GGDEF)-like protein
MKLRLDKVFQLFEKRHPGFWAGLGGLLVGLLGIVDYLTGNDIVFSLFYLIPILLVTLAVSNIAGVYTSILSALILLAAEIAAGQSYSHPAIYFWNTAIRAVFFSFFSYLVAELYQSHREERQMARTDFISGAYNARFFYELLQMEIDRIRRQPHPFTVVYIDLDNFKHVNDLFGHKVGDSVLRYVTEVLRASLRKTDFVARLGGDEFALLLPSTRQADAEVVLTKVRAALEQAMRERSFPVTFSMGVVTCVTPPHAAEQLINLADQLMYGVKNSTKNGIRFMTLEGSGWPGN